jgi:hypothetical protein
MSRFVITEKFVFNYGGFGMKILTKNQQKEILGRLIENYIIAQSALDKSDMNTEDYCDSTKHLIENTCRIAEVVGGLYAVISVHKEIERRMKRILNYENRN